MLEEVEMMETFATVSCTGWAPASPGSANRLPATKSMRIVSVRHRIQINPREIPRRGNTQGGLKYLLGHSSHVGGQ
jgi:hypothetical protein